MKKYPSKKVTTRELVFGIDRTQEEDALIREALNEAYKQGLLDAAEIAENIGKFYSPRLHMMYECWTKEVTNNFDVLKNEIAEAIRKKAEGL